MPQRSALIVRRRHIVRSFYIALLFSMMLVTMPGRSALAGQPLCPGNVNGDSIVDINDLQAVITAWGPCASPCPPSCLADIAPFTGSCVVDIDDLLQVITSWGPCPLTCPLGLTNCNGMCVNLMWDNANCGSCGNQCPFETTCIAGFCEPSEPSPPGQ